jgi:hypothetical protein
MVLTRSMTQKINPNENLADYIIGYKLVLVEPESIIHGPKIDKVFGIVKLHIPITAKTNLDRKVVNKKYASYRTEYARVIYIKSIIGKTIYRRAYSAIKPGGYYITGKITYCNKWNDNHEEVSTNGIHFYLSKQLVFSLYLRLTNYNINQGIDQLMDCTSYPNTKYIHADNDGKIEYTAYFNKKGNLNYLTYFNNKQ